MTGGVVKERSNATRSHFLLVHGCINL